MKVRAQGFAWGILSPELLTVVLRQRLPRSPGSTSLTPHGESRGSLAPTAQTPSP